MALHGDIGENGKLQAVFDVMGIKYTGTGFLGSALAMNKDISKQIFINEGIPVPEGRLFRKEELESALVNAPLPAIVKPCSGGSSVGIKRADTKEELKAALLEAFS